MNFEIIKPSPPLTNFVKHYCFMESELNEKNIIERVIPTESVQLMFHYKNPFIVYHHNCTTTKQPQSIISGLNNSFSDVSTNGQAGVIFVTFFATTACNFFKFPLSEIENQTINLFDIYGEIAIVEEKLFFAKNNFERIKIIEKFLLAKFSPIASHDNNLINKGLEFIKHSNAQISVTELSAKLLTTNKNLERKFSKYLGKSTKQIIKLIRFQEILNNFSEKSNQNFLNCAFENGYFDQSHFIKDFKAYSGFTPKEFLAKYPNFKENSNSQ